LRSIGIQFDRTPLDWFYQFLDPLLLKNNLFESIVFLHSQPPGFNIFLGGVLALGKTPSVILFNLLYISMGLITVMLLHALLRYLEVPRTLSLAASIFFMLSPPVILYENWLFYTYPVTMLILLSAFLLYQYLERPRSSTLILFFSTLVLIILTRTIFHTLWFIAIIVWLLYLQRSRSKQILLCALAPFILISAVHTKNMILFQQTGFSSWFGMNIAKMTLTVPLHKLQEDIDKGVLSPIACLEPFGTPEEYHRFACFNTMTHIPALDMPYKSTGYPNYNHLGYLSVSQQYLKAARHLIIKYPHYYLLSVVKAIYAYLQPCSDRAIFVHENRSRIGIWTTIYEDYLLGNRLRSLWHTTFKNRYGQGRIVHLNFLFFTAPFIIGWSLYTLWKKKLHQSRTRCAVHLFLVSTIIYVTFIGNMLEMSENMRFRFLVVPFFYVLFCLFFKQIFKKSQ